MQFPTTLLAAVLLAGAANAAALTSAVASAAAPAATAVAHHSNDGDKPHHVKINGFDGAHCNKEHDKKTYKLNTNGNCQKLSKKMVYRSFKVEKASRTWECDVKFYKDDLCKEFVGNMGNIDTEENDSCWGWFGQREGSEIQTQSARVICQHPDEIDSDEDHDEHHTETHGPDDGDN